MHPRSFLPVKLPVGALQELLLDYMQERVKKQKPL